MLLNIFKSAQITRLFSKNRKRKRIPSDKETKNTTKNSYSESNTLLDLDLIMNQNMRDKLFSEVLCSVSTNTLKISPWITYIQLFQTLSFLKFLNYCCFCQRLALNSLNSVKQVIVFASKFITLLLQSTRVQPNYRSLLRLRKPIWQLKVLKFQNMNINIVQTHSLFSFFRPFFAFRITFYIKI